MSGLCFPVGRCTLLVNHPSAVIYPAGCTILHIRRFPSAPRGRRVQLAHSLGNNGEGRTSATKPLSFATPSLSIPTLFSCRDTAGKSARLRVESCCQYNRRNSYPSRYRTAFAFSHPHTRIAIGWSYDLPTFQEGAIRAYHVPHG